MIASGEGKANSNPPASSIEFEREEKRENQVRRTVRGKERQVCIPHPVGVGCQRGKKEHQTSASANLSFQALKRREEGKRKTTTRRRGKIVYSIT